MELRQLSPDLTVCRQIGVGDVPLLKAGGFGAIICNRPDGEAADQPDFAAIKAAAELAGIEARHIPIVPGGMTEADIDAFGASIRHLPKPVLAYCRTGNRSATLWSALNARRSSAGAA